MTLYILTILLVSVTSSVSNPACKCISNDTAIKCYDGPAGVQNLHELDCQSTVTTIFLFGREFKCRALKKLALPQLETVVLYNKQFCNCFQNVTTICNGCTCDRSDNAIDENLPTVFASEDEGEIGNVSQTDRKTSTTTTMTPSDERKVSKNEPKSKDRRIKRLVSWPRDTSLLRRYLTLYGGTGGKFGYQLGLGEPPLFPQSRSQLRTVRPPYKWTPPLVRRITTRSPVIITSRRRITILQTKATKRLVTSSASTSTSTLTSLSLETSSPPIPETTTTGSILPIEMPSVNTIRTTDTSTELPLDNVPTSDDYSMSTAITEPEIDVTVEPTLTISSPESTLDLFDKVMDTVKSMEADSNYEATRSKSDSSSSTSWKVAFAILMICFVVVVGVLIYTNRKRTKSVLSIWAIRWKRQGAGSQLLTEESSQTAIF